PSRRHREGHRAGVDAEDCGDVAGHSPDPNLLTRPLGVVQGEDAGDLHARLRQQPPRPGRVVGAQRTWRGRTRRAGARGGARRGAGQQRRDQPAGRKATCATFGGPPEWRRLGTRTIGWSASSGPLNWNGPLPRGNAPQLGSRPATTESFGIGEKATSAQWTKNWASGAESRTSSVASSRARTPASVVAFPLTTSAAPAIPSSS